MKKMPLLFAGSMILLLGTLIGWNAAHRNYERKLLLTSADSEAGGLMTVLNILQHHEAGRTNFVLLGIRAQLEAHADSLESALNSLGSRDRHPDYIRSLEEGRKYLSTHPAPGWPVK